MFFQFISSLHHSFPPHSNLPIFSWVSQKPHLLSSYYPLPPLFSFFIQLSLSLSCFLTKKDHVYWRAYSISWISYQCANGAWTSVCGCENSALWLQWFLPAEKKQNKNFIIAAIMKTASNLVDFKITETIMNNNLCWLSMFGEKNMLVEENVGSVTCVQCILHKVFLVL